MSTIEELRHENLVYLVGKMGGNRPFSSRLNVSESQVSQWLNKLKDSKTGKERSISSASCRRFESALGIERGWFDRDNKGAKTAAERLGLPPLNQALAAIEMALKSAPPDRLEAIATNLAGWAKEGGGGPWAALVLTLLSEPPRKVACEPA